MPAHQSEKVVHLNRYYHFTELMRDAGIEGELLRYQSSHDRTAQAVLVLRPAARESDKLFFFFHGMDGDCGDGVIVRDLVSRLNATVVAAGGRGASWVSSAFLADAEQVIRTYSKDFPKGYYLIGVSMGGTQALSLAGLLPHELRESVLGVIALIPGADLTEISSRSSNERVRKTLYASVGGEVSVLRQRSPAQVLDRYRSELPFVIFYRREDTLLLADELETFIKSLRRKRHRVTAICAPGEHEFTFTDFDYQAAFQKLGSDSTESTAPLISNEQ